MKLKAMYKNRSDIPEGMDQFYTEVNGMFLLDVDEAEGYKLDNPSQLKKTIQDVRKERDEAQAALKSFEGIGDPKAALEAMAKLKELGDIEGMDLSEKIKEGVAQHKADLTTKFENDRLKLEQKSKQDLDSLQGRYDTLFSQYQKTVVDSAARRALQEHGGNPELLLEKILARSKAKINDDGTVDVFLQGDDGHPMMSGEPGNTDNMSIDEYVRSLKNNKNLSVAFGSSGASGSGTTAGSTPGRSGGGGENPVVISSAQMRDINVYKRLKAQAESENRPIEYVD